MSEQTIDRAGWPGFIAKLTGLLPARFRRDTAVVPVVRLSGVIGAVTPLRPGMSLASVARTLERFVQRSPRKGCFCLRANVSNPPSLSKRG